MKVEQDYVMRVINAAVETHNYTRDEIRDGIRQLLEEYKMESMAELLEI